MVAVERVRKRAKVRGPKRYRHIKYLCLYLLDKLFKPCNWYTKTPKMLHVYTPEPLNSQSAVGYTTPMLEQLLSLTPAWDPSSHTPMWNPPPCLPQYGLDHSITSPSRLSNSGDQSDSWLDSRLLNVPLRVIVTRSGLKDKELTACVQCINRCIILCHKVYKTMAILDVGCIKLRQPNPTHDNGLLVVVKGDHCGKHVWWIYHHYEGENEAAIVILAVVEQVDGHVDTLTGEWLELDVSHLCVCKESMEDKGWNGLLMDKLCEEAWKTWAK